MTRDEKIAAIAQVCHEANRSWCQIHDDMSQTTWFFAPQWQQDSAIAGVEAALSGMSPAELHQEWCRNKVAEGWVWGPIKDPAEKLHPCLVPYDKLPPDQRAKDGLFGAIVAALAPALGLS